MKTVKPYNLADAEADAFLILQRNIWKEQGTC